MSPETILDNPAMDIEQGDTNPPNPAIEGDNTSPIPGGAELWDA